MIKTFITHEMAAEIAAMNNEGDEDGWTYAVVIVNEKWAYVTVTDEDGNLLGAL